MLGGPVRSWTAASLMAFIFALAICRALVSNCLRRLECCDVGGFGRVFLGESYRVMLLLVPLGGGSFHGAGSVRFGKLLFRGCVVLGVIGGL